jgi:hypothetical protein
MKILNTKIDPTPFAELEITSKKRDGMSYEKYNHYTQIRQYWTSNRGINGYQVATVLLTDGLRFEHKTGGYGYCKATAGFEWALRKLTGVHYSLGTDMSSLCYHHSTGGNHQKLSMRTLIALLNKSTKATEAKKRQNLKIRKNHVVK